ncbi:hypothetical protein Tco_1066273 [Tanacetum coccineum]|uniref:Uncharacterized protein n=1 Tax=Tanacetum coccineum TaxID=301880 RepID=A0ABQ5H9K9_9ASTR
METWNLKTKHNTGCVLTKTEGNDDFADIVDFLNASSIRYSLTINPTVYVSNIKQFWSTVKTKIANNETQIYAKVAGKSVVSNRTSVGAKEIAILKKRVKKLEKRKRSRTQGLKLFKMGTSKRRSLDKEDASKHGRNLNARLISEEDDFDVGFDVVRDEVNADVSVSTIEPKTPPTTTTTTLLKDDDVTVAATLVQMSDTSKAKSILDDERAGLEEAMRLQAEQEAEHAELIHLDRLLAQRMQEEEEMTEQQKKRQAEVLESAKYYTEEDWDIIRANVESNAELSKILLGENEPGEDFATRMVNLLNQRKKFFAEQRAQARRNRPMTQTQQRTYMSNYLKHQGLWTSAQLKKLSDEEIKAKYKRMKQKTTEVKEVPVTEEPVKEPTAPKQEEIEQPIKKSGRQKSMARKRKLGQSMARKRKLGQSTAKEDEEYEKEKKELIEVEVLEEINMNVVTRLNGRKRSDFGKSQEKWNIVSWKLHKSTGVHTLETDTEMVIHMLVEKKYPLMKKVLLQMLELKLESEDDSTMALELIKFIKQQI